MKEIIQAETLCCVALCVNDFNFSPKNILLNNVKNKKIIEFLASLKHNIHAISKESSNHAKTYPNAISLPKMRFDVIIDLQDLASDLKALDSAYRALLNENGILILKLDSMEKSNDIIKSFDFLIRMPFCVEHENYLFLSRRFHPLADICLQKIDLMQNLEFYNAKIGEAIFALPNYLKRILKDSIRA